MSNTVDKARLQLQLQDVDAQTTQVRWIDEDNGDISYKVLRGPLASAASELRTNLQAYLRSFIQTGDSDNSTAALKRLVSSGKDLFEALFLTGTGDPRAMQARQQYVEMSQQASSLALAIKVDPSLTFPWALAVPTELAPAGPITNAQQFNGVFWCLRHELSVSTFGSAGGRKQLGSGEYRAMALMHRRIYDDARASLQDPAEQQWMNTLLDASRNGISFASDHFVDQVREAAGAPGIRLRFAYLLGHANGERFQFSDSDELTAGVLALRLNSMRSGAVPQHTILFLNGCETAAEGDRFTFSELVGQFSVSGLIGTEVKVPDRFAFRFALAFLHLVLVEGWTLRRALDKLRQEHLPLSLAYTLYAADGLSIAPGTISPELSVALKEASNYSKEQVKCKA
jgi:hypothetical protein